MDILQFTLTIVIPIACFAVLALHYRTRWARVILAAACVTGFLLVAVTARATTKVEGGPAAVSGHTRCNWFRARVQKYGVLDLRLWELRERVTWCVGGGKVTYVSRTWGHWARAGTWKFVRSTRSGGRASNRSWYTRRVSGVFDGWTPAGLFNEEDDPYVWIKVYGDARGHVSYRTGRGY